MENQEQLKVAEVAGKFYENMKKEKAYRQTETKEESTQSSKKSPYIFPALILAFGLIIAAFLYAYAHRYNVNGNYIEDKWTGTYKEMTEMTR